ncbi:hypothetical protein LOD99_11949 [Oopsacas minuta]|uniref:Uncharacterized protein n=1 Tax=Oopsacas minuta TaxID=111878 RepID=A0AAV7JI53_9METZ|nr:hypothetical protein LOD99_11949 [Oopsacas minuta]
MDATEYEAIRGYLQTNIIPPEIKSDRYRKKNFVRKCEGIYFQENKLIKEAEVSEYENIQMDANEPHPFDFPIIDTEWIENLSPTRKADRMTAIENIKIYWMILNLDTMEETFETPQQHSIYEIIDSKLLLLKPRILSALVNNTYLTQLHEKLATKAASLTSLNLLYSYHPPNELNFEIKEKFPVSAGN